MRHLAAREVRLGSPPIPALEKELLHIARTYDFMYTEPARKSGVGSGWTLLESDGPAEPRSGGFCLASRRPISSTEAAAVHICALPRRRLSRAWTRVTLGHFWCSRYPI